MEKWLLDTFDNKIINVSRDVLPTKFKICPSGTVPVKGEIIGRHNGRMHVKIDKNEWAKKCAERNRKSIDDKCVCPKKPLPKLKPRINEFSKMPQLFKKDSAPNPKTEKLKMKAVADDVVTEVISCLRFRRTSLLPFDTTLFDRGSAALV